MMKQLCILLITWITFTNYYSQEKVVKVPEVLKPSKFTDLDFNDAKAYEYNATSKSAIKPQQTHSKVLVFLNNEEAFHQMNLGSGKEIKKIILKTKIKDDIITLTNPKNNEKTILKIDRSADYIKLTDTKTKEVYLAKQKRIKNNIVIPVQ
ncbi:hypothetical protein [Chryseobacterium sp. JUb7]|uniref:hypothetical protein n=1 Tax=Chryseobacterium sp. JUb7 TaxID=2940599 RepID=UPI0021683409|nr:hypothetical protein [Chryseobacterium sp. JUb7]MCS3530173.1 hypothetical protein [Chryseobacterium sp. JUb7]